jgi:hypothetical protein
MVGDAQVPLLRIVPVEGRDGEMITRVFDQIEYCPLLQRRFQTVEIDIRDDTGSIVQFERGRVVVTLHCRKRRYQRGHGLGSIFGGLFEAAMTLLKTGAKTLGREALKSGLNIAGDVVQGRNIKQAAEARLKSTGQNLFQKAMDTVGPPGQRAIKGPAKLKKTRRRQIMQRNTSNDIFG